MFRNLFGSSKTTASSEANTNMPAPSISQPTETILGSGTKLEGTLHSPGAVRIEGKFTGDLTALGHVTLSSDADLEGDIVGDAIIVGGILRGNVTAKRVTILRTGRVWGDLQTEQLATEEGSFIQGIITMQEQMDIPSAIGDQQEASIKEETAENKATESHKEPAGRIPVEIRKPSSKR